MSPLSTQNNIEKEEKVGSLTVLDLKLTRKLQYSQQCGSFIMADT